MAFSPKLALLLISSLTLFQPSLSRSKLSDANSELHELLTHFDFPKGLFPDTVKSYTFSATDNSFSVKLSDYCYAYISGEILMVIYYPNITGKIEVGKLSDISGIYAAGKKAQIYVPVTSITVKDEDTLIFDFAPWFDEEVPVADFASVPNCLPIEIKAKFGDLPHHLAFKNNI